MSERPSALDNGARRPSNTDQRLRAAWPFCAIGVASIVTGGLVASLTRPLDLESGPWISAYLVLVSGVAQIGLGAGQAALAPHPPSSRVVSIEIVAWNASTATILLGTVIGWPVLTSAGALALLLAVGSFVRQVPGAPTGRRWSATAHWALGALVALSAPVGVMLAWIRHG